MSRRNREKALRQLREVSSSSLVELCFRDGRQETGYIYRVESLYLERREEPHLFYASKPWSPEIGPQLPVLPEARLHELGYIRVRGIGKKISLMAFHPSSD